MTDSLANLIHEVTRMTSREIATLVGKQHGHVMRDIRSTLQELEAGHEANPELDWLCETGTYIDEQGKCREMYLLDKNTTLILVTGYSVLARAKVIKRWQDLEDQVPSTEALYQALWLKHRHQAAMNYSRLMDAYKEKLLFAGYKENKILSLVKDEAEFINSITHGLLSGRFRAWFGIGYEQGIRDHMPDKLLDAIASVEQQNFALLMADVPRDQRWDIIDKYLNAHYPDVISFRNRQEARLAEIREMTDGEKHLPLHPKDDPALSSYTYIDSLRNLTPKQGKLT
jgi:Rha family phage regulatory protein